MTGEDRNEWDARHANEYRITMYALDYETATDIAHALPFNVTRGYYIQKLDENGRPYEFDTFPVMDDSEDAS